MQLKSLSETIKGRIKSEVMVIIDERESEIILMDSRDNLLEFHSSLRVVFHPNQSMSPSIPHRENINLTESPKIELNMSKTEW